MLARLLLSCVRSPALTVSFNPMRLRDPELDSGWGRMCLALLWEKLVGPGCDVVA